MAPSVSLLICRFVGYAPSFPYFHTKPLHSRLLIRAAVVQAFLKFLAGQKARFTAIPELAGRQLVGLWLQVD